LTRLIKALRATFNGVGATPIEGCSLRERGKEHGKERGKEMAGLGE
jgi:hypothetical protein